MNSTLRSVILIKARGQGRQLPYLIGTSVSLLNCGEVNSIGTVLCSKACRWSLVYV